MAARSDPSLYMKRGAGSVKLAEPETEGEVCFICENEFKVRFYIIHGTVQGTGLKKLFCRICLPCIKAMAELHEELEHAKVRASRVPAGRRALPTPRPRRNAADLDRLVRAAQHFAPRRQPVDHHNQGE